MTSIRGHLTRRLILGALFLTGASWIALWLSARSTLIDQFDRNLRAHTHTIAALLEWENGAVEMESLDRLPSRFRRDNPEAFFAVFDEQVHQLFGSTSLHGQPDCTPPYATTKTIFWNVSLPRARHGRAIARLHQIQAAKGNETVAGSVRIVVVSDRDDLDEGLLNFLVISVTAAVLLLGLATYATPRMIRSGLKPLDDLGTKVSHFDATRLSGRIETTSLPHELSPIATRLNELLQRLEHAFNRERRINSDLAHELRTPIAELRTLAESALTWPGQRDPQSDSDTLAIAVHLQGLVDRMLELARSENGRIVPVLIDADLAANAMATVDAFASRASARNISFQHELSPIETRLDPVLMRSIFNNLIDNAIEYSPEGSTIQLTGGNQPRPWLALTNLAPELSINDVPRLFERLWRKQSARSSGEHFGLGLPLVLIFAEAMGWTVSARLDANQFLELKVSQKNSEPLPT